MIYASDLDRTLIYSLGAIGVPENTPGLIPAEIIEGKTRSYISQQALNQLMDLNTRIIFIPVTTRTIQQYKRINLFQETVIPDYAVTSNGGNILIGGVVDKEWRESIGRLVARHSAGAEEVRSYIKAVVREDWIISENYCDDLFYSFMVYRDQLPLDEITNLSDRLYNLGWRVSLQGRKLYAVPAAVNKSDAILHLRRTVRSEPMVASGDSLLDKSLLESADYAIAPCHGEIFAEQQSGLVKSRYPFTKESGVFAGDEILQYVNMIYNNLTALGVGPL
ncbi:MULTISPECIES: HAD family hydrolase [Paenibacillus]|jgi:hydroxymethylpyrimidine pyrophosphatase-like HAD family hydrolase|uniref:Hydrolase n=1 Tax=Paenibacillus odorifer TaxID=189426 RepID=A0A1R0Y9X7_9BACL|nr:MULTISPECIES: HAD family hydrolase [Paenibacillus]AIQ21692.1 hydrolase [Paenibacillus sp. FSL H7-0737]OMD44182.1 hydrolase [Paenibacillus odorifer]WHY19782.1 HAD family hydrolase [Paenibacillus sp. G2S3]